jgi:hypothetical protein
MASVAQMLKEGVGENGGKPIDGLVESLSKRLCAAGLEAPLKVVEIDCKTGINPDCNYTATSNPPFSTRSSMVMGRSPIPGGPSRSVCNGYRLHG